MSTNPKLDQIISGGVTYDMEDSEAARATDLDALSDELTAKMGNLSFSVDSTDGGLNITYTPTT